jgi:O6-methylguanine-DNA--protein-cysteine methyltransferase
MTPSDCPSRAVGREVLHFTIGVSSLGKVLVATSEKGLCAVLPGSEDKSLMADLKGRNPRVVLMQGGDVVERALSVVLTTIETGQVDSDLVIAPRGTDFQRRVWDALREIPVGSTATYKEIAAKVGVGTARKSERPVRQIPSRCSFLAIESCAATADSPAIAGAFTASVRYSKKNKKQHQRPTRCLSRQRAVRTECEPDTPSPPDLCSTSHCRHRLESITQMVRRQRPVTAL